MVDNDFIKVTKQLSIRKSEITAIEITEEDIYITLQTGTTIKLELESITYKFRNFLNKCMED